MRTPALGKCASPSCKAEFKRLGTGKIYTLPVTDPELWGLPEHIKQKVVWLCSKCARSKEVQFDSEHHQVLLVNRGPSRRISA